MTKKAALKHGCGTAERDRHVAGVSATCVCVSHASRVMCGGGEPSCWREKELGRSVEEGGLEDDVDRRVRARAGVGALVEDVRAVEDEDAALLQALGELGGDPWLPVLDGGGEILVPVLLEAVEDGVRGRLVEGEVGDVFLEVQGIVERVLGVGEEIVWIKADVIGELGPALRRADANRDEPHSRLLEPRHRLLLESGRELLAEESSVAPQEDADASLVAAPERGELDALVGLDGAVHLEALELLIADTPARTAVVDENAQLVAANVAAAQHQRMMRGCDT
eukprot:CAMPEP_0197394778 /NCGR_PEP_ID=MMETSP1165-20131217/6049_1 /TAXON_ID=284809 /ORGANISM="Chrysocystis fragilis, Strain CCMP3189" /LENGTH=280 /DNA_ID=CAMNT_0042920511 /DNA_START=46 /DNA_END=886 /DNA_ORIENTATION=-